MFELAKNKNIYLAPKNELTQYASFRLKNIGHEISGFIDNYNQDADVVQKKVFEKGDIVFIYSPKYWKEISANISGNNIYVLEFKNNEFYATKLSDFSGYEKIEKLDYNNIEAQKFNWERKLKEYKVNNENLEQYGFEWGNPEDSNYELGNYLEIKNLLQNSIQKNHTVLEIGTLGGKWTAYMTNAKKIICVDINEYFIEAINSRFSKEVLEKIQFYVSNGNELNGVESDSVDVIFTIDTLVRAEKEFIFDYIKEIKRVLKEGGKAIIHLPNSDMEDSRERGFTDISTDEIDRELGKYFKNYRIDSELIIHGSLIFINFEKKI